MIVEATKSCWRLQATASAVTVTPIESAISARRRVVSIVRPLTNRFGHRFLSIVAGGQIGRESGAFGGFPFWYFPVSTPPPSGE